MKKLVGIIGLVLALAACGQTTNNDAPEPQEAPITSMSGVIPDEAGQYGILAFTGGTWSDGTQRFLQPAIPFQFDASGEFTVALPISFATDFNWGPEARGCGLGDTAILGLAAASSEPFADGAVALTALRTSYRLEAPDGTLALAWYSPDNRRVLCELLDDRMTGSDHLTIDLRLVAGWNEVAYTLDGGRGLFRSGRVTGAQWRAFLD